MQNVTDKNGLMLLVTLPTQLFFFSRPVYESFRSIFQTLVKILRQKSEIADYGSTQGYNARKVISEVYASFAL